MKNIFFAILRIALLLLLGTQFYKAQQVVIPAGFTVQGSSGSSSQSIGQIINQSQAGSSGKVNQGVQQPYEIYILGTDDNALQDKITVYPNPVKDFLIVDFDRAEQKNASYKLFDGSGKLITSGSLKNLKNEINTSTLSSGMYMLSIVNEDKTLKTFKIIKNR